MSIRFLLLITWISCIPDVATTQCLPTGSDIEGPYYVTGAPETDSIIAPVLQSSAQKIRVRGTVYFSGCEVPVPDPVIDIWHTDELGEYSNVEGNPDDFAYRARVKGNVSGEYLYYSVFPGLYPGRPRHTHFKVWVNDTLKLTSQMYFEGDPLNASDPWASNAEPNRVVELDTLPNGDLEARMDIYLIDSPWTSIEDPQSPGASSFLVFPNPVDRSRLIRLPEIMTVSMVDMAGRLVLDRQQTAILDVGLLPPGRYVIRSSDGRSVPIVIPAW
ncbi:MAG: hypothetical protein H6568_10230 [Lewinellaceae bacterium]|nr:hypothetical protein [Lewinellaceae bacterium]